MTLQGRGSVMSHAALPGSAIVCQRTARLAALPPDVTAGAASEALDVVDHCPGDKKYYTTM